MSLTPVQPAIRVSELVKRFPHTTALAGISFELRRGEVLGLLGPNGAGKTTTLHVLFGLVQPTSGSVRLFGADPFTDRETALRQVGFTSPEAMMDWRLTVRENLRVFAGLYGATPGAVERALELFELAPHARSKFGDLSLGQQMRAGMARALLHDPAILVLDEPTSSLDPDIADKTRKLLLRLRSERGLSILYTSHNMAEVEEVCDRVIFLHRGCVVAEGTPLEVSKRVLGSEDLDSAAMEEVFLRISRGGRDMTAAVALPLSRGVRTRRQRAADPRARAALPAAPAPRRLARDRHLPVGADRRRDLGLPDVVCRRQRRAAPECARDFSGRRDPVEPLLPLLAGRLGLLPRRRLGALAGDGLRVASQSLGVRGGDHAARAGQARAHAGRDGGGRLVPLRLRPLRVRLRAGSLHRQSGAAGLDGRADLARADPALRRALGDPGLEPAGAADAVRVGLLSRVGAAGRRRARSRRRCPRTTCSRACGRRQRAAGSRGGGSRSPARRTSSTSRWPRCWSLGCSGWRCAAGLLPKVH